jgi:hypothetical protein
MATMFVRHHVADLATGKKACDDFDEERQRMGEVGDGVYQADGSPNDVTLHHRFATMEGSRAFANSARLHEVMTQAGVRGQPHIWSTTKV